MKAAQIHEYGDPSVVRVDEIDKPSAGEGQVLVEVHASSLSPFDTIVRAGHVKNMIKSLPVTLGGDIAGIVQEAGPGVTGLVTGDKVYGQAASVAGNSGAFAEFAVTKSSQVAKAPGNLDFDQTASLPLVGVSALQALTDHLNLQSGQKIFIHGAGGIGLIAIQIAKSIGAYVAVTATGEAATAAKQLGADEVIDFKSQNYTEILRDYDAVFDTVGDDFDKALTILKRGGVAVSMAAQADEAKTKELGVTATAQSTHVTTEKLDKLRKLVETGAVKPQVGKVFTLDQIREAFEARESGEVAGKVVLSISTDEPKMVV